MQVVGDNLPWSILISTAKLVERNVNLPNCLGWDQSHIMRKALATNEKLEPFVLQGCLLLWSLAHCINHHLLLLRLPTRPSAKENLWSIGWTAATGLIEELKGLLEPDVGFLGALEIIASEGKTIALIVKIFRRFYNRLHQVVFLGYQLSCSFIEQKASIASAVKVISPQLLFQDQRLLLSLELCKLISDGLSIWPMSLLKLEIKQMIDGKLQGTLGGLLAQVLILLEPVLDLGEVIGLDEVLDGVLLQGVGVFGSYHNILSLLSS